MFELIIIAILFVSTLAFIYFSNIRRDKVEKQRFREFVISNKTSNINEYVEALPNDEPLPIKEEDEYIDLEDLSPEELLHIKQEELKK